MGQEYSIFMKDLLENTWNFVIIGHFEHGLTILAAYILGIAYDRTIMGFIEFFCFSVLFI